MNSNNCGIDTMAKRKDVRPLAEESSSVEDEDIVVGKWRANKRELVQVKIRKFNRHTLIDIRRWYLDADGNLCPGRNGISCQPGHLKRLRRALRKAYRLLNGGP
jgi:hypothetical protein